jgi:hypothetical protein
MEYPRLSPPYRLGGIRERPKHPLRDRWSWRRALVRRVVETEGQARL